MSNVRATFAVKFYGVLPDDEGAADDMFDLWADVIDGVLNHATFGEDIGICAQSFTIEDGDTEPDE